MGSYRAGLYQACRAVPPGVLRGRPEHGPCLRAGLARARYRSGRAGLGPGQKTGLMGRLSGSGLHGHLYLSYMVKACSKLSSYRVVVFVVYKKIATGRCQKDYASDHV